MAEDTIDEPLTDTPEFIKFLHEIAKPICEKCKKDTEVATPSPVCDIFCGVVRDAAESEWDRLYAAR